MRATVFADALLVILWASGNRKIKTGQALTEFDAFLTSIPQEPPQENRILPEEVIESIRRVESLLEAHRDPQTAKLCNLAQRIVREVHDLVMPILMREATYDAEVMTCARIGLVATAAFADQATGLAEAHSLLCEVIRCLAVVQQRIDGGIRPNEVIVLVRA